MSYRVYGEGTGGCASNCVLNTKSEIVDYVINHNFINEEKLEITYLPEVMGNLNNPYQDCPSKGQSTTVNTSLS